MDWTENYKKLTSHVDVYKRRPKEPGPNVTRKVKGSGGWWKPILDELEWAGEIEQAKDYYMATVLLVDASILVYQAHNTTGDGTRGRKFAIQAGANKGEPTGLRYGFIRGVRSYMEKTRASKTVICWDCKGPIVKAQTNGDYKANRPWDEDKEKMYSQVPKLRDLLNLTCWTQAEAPGYEADDIQGTLAKRLSEQGHRVWIATKDRDMLQCVNGNVSVLFTGTNQKIYSIDEVQDEFGVKPSKLLYYRAVEGDSSDNLPGLGMGSVGLTQWKNFLSSLPDGFVQLSDVEEQCKKRLPTLHSLVFEGANGQRFMDNLNIMALHAPQTIQLIKGTRDAKALEAEFNRLEFKSMIKFVPQIAGTIEEEKATNG